MGFGFPWLEIYTTLYTTYIGYCLLGGLYATYHLLWEPETTIEKKQGYKESYY